MNKSKPQKILIKINYAYIPVAVLFIIHSIFFLFTMAPDFFGISLPNTMINPIFYIPPLLTALFFCYREQKEKRIFFYFLKILYKPILLIGAVTFVLLPVSFFINSMRCAQSGFCVGGEPFDYMSTIFLVFLSFSSTAMAIVLSIIVGTIFRIYTFVKNKN